jgi:hypothetical protein
MTKLTNTKTLLARICIGAHVFVPRLQAFATRPNSKPALVVRYHDYSGKPDRVSAVDRKKLTDKLTVLVNNGFVSQGEIRTVTAETIRHGQAFQDLERRARVYGVSAVEAVDMALASLDILERKYRPENACRFYMHSVANGFKPARVGQVVCLFLLQKRHQNQIRKFKATTPADKKDGKNYWCKLRYLLAAFARHFRKRLFHEILAAEMQAWLDSLGLEDQNFNNYRGAIKTLSNFAEAHLYFQRSRKHEVDFVSRRRVEYKEPPVLEPKNLRILLDGCYDPKLLLWIVVKAFSGGRTCEVKLLDWTKFRPGKDVHYAEELVKKYTQARYVPIQPVLDAWLKPFYRSTPDLLCPGSETEDEVTAFAATLGVKLLRNIFRKTYAALRMAQVKNPQTVTYELGETKTVCYRHYLSDRAQEMAQEHWDLFPPPDWETRWQEILAERYAAAEKRKAPAANADPTDAPPML